MIESNELESQLPWFDRVDAASSVRSLSRPWNLANIDIDRHWAQTDGGRGVTVADDVTITAFSHLEGAAVASGAESGPCARLRPGAEIGAKAKVGNFVEIKKATLGEGAEANHLSYIGDASVGAGANIGAGTITCNYAGFFKYRTEIGAGAFIGSNSALVAPASIGEGAIVAAGSVVTRPVEADSLCLVRPEQVGKVGWAARFRERMRAKKAGK